jgi:hypothetical protein
MAYTDFNFTLFRGDDRNLTVEALAPGGGGAQDLTSWSLWFTGKLDIGDADVAAVFQYTIGGGITITNAAGGLATIAIDGDDTAVLTDASTVLWCDLQGKDGSGKVATLATGKITVEAEVTRTEV